MSSKLLLGELDLEIGPEPKSRPVSDEENRRIPLVGGEAPEFWFVLPMLSEADYNFVWVSCEAITRENDGEQAHAMTFTDRRVVAFDYNLKRPKNRKVLNIAFLHEIDHIGLSLTGEGVVNYMFGRTDKAATRKEEAVCARHSVTLANPLVARGILRLPKWRPLKERKA